MHAVVVDRRTHRFTVSGGGGRPDLPIHLAARAGTDDEVDMSALHWFLDGYWTVGGHPLDHREVIGNAFGLASAVFGMRRLTWAWPVGIVGNVLLFTVYVGGIFDKPQTADLWGQAGRQIFFAAVSIYGWWQWRRNRRSGAVPDGTAVMPRWAQGNELRAMILAGTVMMFAFFYSLRALGSYGPLSDAWILTGSILATYGMARGFVDFWWIWVGVDVVGVPLLIQANYYPSAVMYVIYGSFCIGGFFSWHRIQRDQREPMPAAVLASQGALPEEAMSGT
jgi:nicotinamide mononucleotide transporter